MGKWNTLIWNWSTIQMDSGEKKYKISNKKAGGLTFWSCQVLYFRWQDNSTEFCQLLRISSLGHLPSRSSSLPQSANANKHSFLCECWILDTGEADEKNYLFLPSNTIEQIQGFRIWFHSIFLHNAGVWELTDRDQGCQRIEKLHRQLQLSRFKQEIIKEWAL